MLSKSVSHENVHAKALTNTQPLSQQKELSQDCWELAAGQQVRGTAYQCHRLGGVQTSILLAVETAHCFWRLPGLWKLES